MRLFSIRLNIVAIHLLCILSSISVADTSTDNDIHSIKRTIRAALPSTTITTIKPTTMSGIYEVVAGQKVFYTDATGTHLIVGHLYDLQTAKDITQHRINVVHQQSIVKLLSSLPQHAFLEFGEGNQVLTLLFDPLCAWCKKLYMEIKQIPDIRFRVVFSVAGSALDRSVSILCTLNPQNALDQVMKKQPLKTLADTECDQTTRAALKQINELTQEHQLAGTPYLISSDGRVSQGYLSKDNLLAWLKNGNN